MRRQRTVTWGEISSSYKLEHDQVVYPTTLKKMFL